jgi:hypothetical protein
MKEEMAFLKYRREVVSAWPDSPRKTAFLTAIESRILLLEQSHPEQRLSESVRAVD